MVPGRRAPRSLFAFLLLGLCLTDLGCGGGSGGATAASTAAATPTTPPVATPTSSGPAAMVSYVNSLRALGGLPSVTDNTTLSQGLALHAHFMVRNDQVGHFEE